MEQIVMQIIIHAGDAKTYAYEALNKASVADYELADSLIEKANEAISKAHAVQTQLLQKEAEGENIKISLLFIHAQDHLMTAISEKNLIVEIIKLRKELKSIIK
ncbi:PTS lactose/cellobiose transporter subunit IIA [Caloramator proteoclasticus]|nr:PTS lactose/cellobiose transporter subunit IIA [Caloramator proteoclasticus]